MHLSALAFNTGIEDQTEVLVLAWQAFYQLSYIPSSIASFLITQNLTGDPDYACKSPVISSHIMLHVPGTLGTMGLCNDNDFHLIVVL